MLCIGVKLMKTKIFEIKRKMSCKNMVECSDNIIEKLKPMGLILRADKENDIVNGYVSIVHEPNDHFIVIGIYQENENANDEHKTILEPPITIPKKNQLESLI
jgi:hypothetical protein